MGRRPVWKEFPPFDSNLLQEARAESETTASLPSEAVETNDDVGIVETLDQSDQTVTAAGNDEPQDFDERLTYKDHLIYWGLIGPNEELEMDPNLRYQVSSKQY